MKSVADFVFLVIVVDTGHFSTFLESLCEVLVS